MSHKLLWTTGALVGSVAFGGLLWQRGASTAAPHAGVSTPAATGSAPGANAAPAAPIAVEVVVLAPEPLEVQVPATGTLLGRESVALVSELSRRLVKVHADEGMAVDKGDVLFELDSTDLRAELAKAEVQARLARATLDRTEKLGAEGLSNQQELELARARLDELGAERQLLSVTLQKTMIRAPFSGELGLRRVSEGAWVSPSTLLATLQDTSSLKLDFTLPERYAGAVRRGGTFRFRVDGQSETFTGKITALEPSVDAATRSLLVRGVVDGATALLPGSSASIEVPLRVEQALLVPAIAIIPGIEGRRVYVADAGRVRSVPVEIGFRAADRAQVLSGLAPGDRVITTNLLRLREGAPVKISSEPGVR